VLGPRWVYDGLADPVGVAAIASAILTGGHEAALTMEKDGGTVTFEPSCRVVGSGSSSPVPPAPVTMVDAGDPTVVRMGDLARVLGRVVGTPVDGEQTLSAEWGGQAPVVVAAVRPAGSSA
jgi:hypothetical protein